MADGITVYGAVPNANELITTMGKAVHQSGLLGCENEAQGVVLAMTCFAKGSDPMSLAQRYHIFNGKLSMKSEAMLADLRARGGKHKIIKRTADEAVIQLTFEGDTQEFSFCWTEAQGEPFIYKGKESEIIRFIAANNQKMLAERLKPKYATPRARMQMLWARVVSDGVRAMCPEVNLGTYTPEEISDFDDDGRAAPSTVAASDPAAPSMDAPDDEPIEDATFEPAGKGITPQQIARMNELFTVLKISPDVQIKSCKKRGADNVTLLSREAADELLGVLDAKYGETLGETIGESKAETDTTSESVADAMISEANINIIKSLIRQMAQTPGNGDIAQRIKAHLEKYGLSKVADLTESAGQVMIGSLNKQNLAAFFDLELQVASAKNG